MVLKERILEIIQYKDEHYLIIIIISFRVSAYFPPCGFCLSYGQRSAIIPITESLISSPQDYHDDIRQEQMWEMQALTSTPALGAHSLEDSQSPTINASNQVGGATNSSSSGANGRGLGGGLADMDTSNDDKSDDASGMECLSAVDKLECSSSCASTPGSPTRWRKCAAFWFR